MFVGPGYLSKQLSEIEKVRLKTIQENQHVMKAAGIETMANNLFALKKNGGGKTTNGKNMTIRDIEDDESLSFCSDDEPQAKKVRRMGPGTKKVRSCIPVLRKSQRNQEKDGNPNGSTLDFPNEPTSNDVEGITLMVPQHSELPASPTEHANDVINGIGSTSLTAKKGVRGPTRGLGVDKYRKKLGHPIPIEIDREAMTIVGDFATSAAYALGESIRCHAPVRDIGWKEIEFGIRESILLRVGQTFGLGDYKNDMVLRTIVDVKCQALYAEWKCKLHKRYKKLKKKVTDPKDHPLYPCNPTDWVFMIDNVWQTKAWKKKSKRGKKARKCLKYNHTSGSQSFVSRAYKFRIEKKREPTFPESFKETHIRHRLGKKVWIDDKAKKHHDEIVKKIEEQEKPGATNPQSEVQISVDVLGKRSGYLKGYDIRKSTYNTQSQRLPNCEVVALKQQVADQGQVIADYAKKFKDMMFMLASGVNPSAIPELLQKNIRDGTSDDQNESSTHLDIV